MRRYLVAGLLVWLPLGVTLLVVKLLVDLMDRSLLLLPPAYRPDVLLGFHIPGLGIVLTFLVLLATGVVLANFLGHRLVGAWESLLARIPLIRSVYSGAKQVAETVLSDGGQSFKKVLLIEYPRKGIWSIAFQTSRGLGQVAGQPVVCAFVPTTPNPTSGFIVMVPEQDAVELGISVDEALRMVISLGVVIPAGLTAAGVTPVAPPGITP